MIVWRVTGSTGIVSACSFFREHATAVSAASARKIFLFKVFS
jgi:hypothetical protein